MLAVGKPARWVSFNPVSVDTPLQKGHHVDLVAYSADTLLDGVTWRKSRHSNPSGNCVELAGLADGTVAIRNSRHPAGPALLCGPAEFAAFLAAARDGEFDSLLG